MRIDLLLGRAGARLASAGSPTARLDAEVLAMKVLGVDRTWLYTWGGRPMEPLARARFEALVAARAQGTPVAYLTGEREFWGLTLETAPSTLIPRPDTETLVTAALEKAQADVGRFLDLGTGTGAIALAVASERPAWHVTAVDLSVDAVGLARRNARRHGLQVRVQQSDWFTAVAGERFDLIASNPPYIDPDDPHLDLGDVRYEPASALVAADRGLADLFTIADQAREHLTVGGWLMMEHGFDQATAVRDQLIALGYANASSLRDLAGHSRVTLGQWLP
ncbi:peptide chain release factor N(5)-glutamine methyltransferase [Halomonas denitrificans]|uniref:peptide chain release factor N(5)-glutamine methyltransferase n=1 Tax=Halomonas denitrificans TaxID=370769 RepID=UPI001C994C94|nr:peptide chain release factor N(5)-glutamine methyltransferase [Halomonas denitrificans]MBY5969090.1 peptide chain release factor N(5)-glutamine methyltransferase [Halomonas denitrificans]